MSEILVYVWIGVFIVALIIELATSELVSVWFALGSLISLILAVCHVHWSIQLIVFVLTSGVFLFLFKLLFQKKLKKPLTPTNFDSLIGKDIILISDCNKNKIGEGKIRDVIWSVCCDDDNSYSNGEIAIIKAVDGNKIIINKKEKKL